MKKAQSPGLFLLIIRVINNLIGNNLRVTVISVRIRIPDDLNVFGHFLFGFRFFKQFRGYPGFAVSSILTATSSVSFFLFFAVAFRLFIRDSLSGRGLERDIFIRRHGILFIVKFRVVVFNKRFHIADVLFNRFRYRGIFSLVPGTILFHDLICWFCSINSSLVTL